MTTDTTTAHTMRKLSLLALATLTVSCTDAGRARIAAYGNAATVSCWSGDSLIYRGRSTGKVLSENGSDGYFFRDSLGTVEVSGNCVVRYDP